MNAASGSNRSAALDHGRTPACSITAREFHQPLLQVRNLTVRINQPGCTLYPVQNLSFDVYPNQTLAIVGESGSGKTMTALALLGLLTQESRSVAGDILFDGEYVAGERLSQVQQETNFARLRGKEIAMIFQEPRSALNPVIRIGSQINDVLRKHADLSVKAAEIRTLELLRNVGLQNVREIYQQYPHELSGGMCQRVMIAMALSCSPRLIVADEPTTALDVTTQSQILSLVERLQETHKFGLVLISHDLEVVARLADWTIVLHSGQLVEEGATGRLLQNPDHDCTKALVNAMLRMPADKLE